MSAIGPGDVLECTRTDIAFLTGETISAGNVYRCEEVVQIAGRCSVTGTDISAAILLQGFARLSWFCRCCFKPGGYRPDEAIERLLKQPTREHERA